MQIRRISDFFIEYCISFAYKGKNSKIPIALNLYKKLAGQTLVYGLGTIVPRILNYAILTFYFTRLFSVEQFGVITELYAYVAFLLIILTYGTETGFFRFAMENNRRAVFGSIVILLFISSCFFIIAVLLFRKNIATALQYEGNIEYISMLAVIVAIDAFSAILFAKLRREERGLKFATLKILNVIITVLCVLIFYEWLPSLLENSPIGLNIKLRSDISFVLLSNLIASACILILLLPEIFEEKIEFDLALLKQLLIYSLPLMVAGLAGTINETLDRILLKHLIINKAEAMYALGIYGANYRIAVLLFIFIQMFRYAAEPFYFNYYEKGDYKVVFSRIMRLFIVITILISLTILFYLDYIKYFIPSKYHEGLNIVPIVLLGYVCYGIFFNQSMWYKFSKRTGFAIVLTVIGAVVTILINVLLVPVYSYIASAWAHVVSYSTMIVVSFFIGRKYFYIDYKLLIIIEYVVIAVAIFAFRAYFFSTGSFISDMVSGILIISYALYVLIREKLFNSTRLFSWKLKL
jgi:O-antigen/teichoic acid export membrane protein